MKPELWPGILVGILLFGLCLLLLGILGYHSQPIDWGAWYRDPYWQEVLRFTWLQACLSTLFSLVIAVPLACALIRRHFWGRQWLLQLFSLSMVLPTVVAVFGLITLYGRQGWLVQLCTQLGFSYGGSLYGLPGIVLVHVFFNLPLATRLFFYRLRSQPLSMIRLAAQLGMSAYHCFCWLEWPRLRSLLPAVASVLFALCLNNLASGLLLSGGPRSTPLALAIYQAVQEKDQLGQLFPILLLQFMSGVVLYFLCQYFTGNLAISRLTSLDALTDSNGLWQDGPYQRAWDWLWILLGSGIVLFPLLAVVIEGCNGLLLLALKRIALWQALGYSLLLGVSSSLLAVILAGSLLLSISQLPSDYHRYSRWLLLSGILIAWWPPLVIAMALLYLLPGLHRAELIDGLIIFTNGIIAIPYAIKILAGPLETVIRRTQALCQGLGIQGMNRWRLIYIPLLYRPFIFAVIITLLLSTGEIGIFALFGQGRRCTLSRYLYQQLSSYRSEEAAVSALLLLLVCWGLLMLSEKLARHDHTT